MTETLKLLLIAGLFLIVGFLLGGRRTIENSSAIAPSAPSASGVYTLTGTPGGIFLTDTRNGKAWLFEMDKSGAEKVRFV